jgi:tetratricopeptide (TPR) repeat protein
VARARARGDAGHDRPPRAPLADRGIAVYEEHRARPGWGDDVDLDFVAALEGGKLLPIESLNDGFVRPESPEQVSRSYYQASLVVELIERDHGFEALRRLLQGYRERRGTRELFASALGSSLEQFDARFSAYLRERFARALASVRVPDPQKEPPRRRTGEELVAAADAAPGDFLLQLAAGKALVENRQPAAARAYLQRALALFPEYNEDDSPSWLLAQLELEDKNPAAARGHLETFLAANEKHYDAHLRLASVDEQLGDRAAAARWLERALCIDPSEPSVHLRLAELYDSLGDTAGLVRARRKRARPRTRRSSRGSLPARARAPEGRGRGRRAARRARGPRAGTGLPPGADAPARAAPRTGGAKRRPVVRRAGLVALVVLGGLPAAADLGRPPGVTYENLPYDGRFTFNRLRFTPAYWGPGNYAWGLDLKWNHDYPRADVHLERILQATTSIDVAVDGSNILALDDPELFRHPVAYLCEPGFWALTDCRSQWAARVPAEGRLRDRGRLPRPPLGRLRGGAGARAARRSARPGSTPRTRSSTSSSASTPTLSAIRTSRRGRPRTTVSSKTTTRAGA